MNLRAGDIFASGADVLVIPVNTVAVAGAGLALEAKQRWPRWHRDYWGHCKTTSFRAGDWIVHPPEVADRPRLVSFATKAHWSNPSRIQWIEQGLPTLAEVMTQIRPGSIAIPALGCGRGGLAWVDVRPLIEAAAERMEAVGITVLVYEPEKRR